MTPDSSMAALSNATRAERPKALCGEPVRAKGRKPFHIPADPHFKLVASTRGGARRRSAPSRLADRGCRALRRLPDLGEHRCLPRLAA